MVRHVAHAQQLAAAQAEYKQACKLVRKAARTDKNAHYAARAKEMDELLQQHRNQPGVPDRR